jgi:hypothetical protein
LKSIRASNPINETNAPASPYFGLEKVGESYGTSISLLRELLNRMCPEGLIAEGQRGFEVASESADDFRQVAALRLLFENHAMEQSFQLGDLDWEGLVVSARAVTGRTDRAHLPVPVGNLIRLASEAESRNVSGL